MIDNFRKFLLREKSTINQETYLLATLTFNIKKNSEEFAKL